MTFRAQSSHACAQVFVLPETIQGKQTQPDLPNERLHGCPQRSIFVTLTLLAIFVLILQQLYST